MEEMLKQMISEAVQQGIMDHIRAINETRSNDSAAKEIMNSNELAEYLRVSKSWISSHLSEIPHMKLDSNLRFRKQHIDEWLDNKVLYAIASSVTSKSASRNRCTQYVK